MRNSQRSLVLAAWLTALVACDAGEPNTSQVEGAATNFLSCDELVEWRADYGEIGEGVVGDVTAPDIVRDPDPTPFIGQLRCPPPPGYEYDTTPVIINLYWSPPSNPPGGGSGSGSGSGTPPDASGDAGGDGGGDARDGAPDGGGSGSSRDAAPSDGNPGSDAGCGSGSGSGHLVIAEFAPPPGGQKPVQPRPVVPVEPAGTPQTRIPIPADAAKPAPIRIEPQRATTPAAATTPRFTNPAVKLQQTARPEFRAQLWTDLLLLDPAFGARGKSIHMGYWSGNGAKNRDALIRLLDDINTGGGANARAFFDEGISPSQLLPAYRTMTAEAWYGRAKFVDGKGSLAGGEKIVDPFPTSFASADAIWGQYSARYTQMALDAFSATGNVVDVWCFVENAKSDRIFYKYELPALKDLETLGIVRVHFAKKLDAKFNVPGDWIVGTQNAPPAGPPANP